MIHEYQYQIFLTISWVYRCMRMRCMCDHYSRSYTVDIMYFPCIQYTIFRTEIVASLFANDSAAPRSQYHEQKNVEML